MKYFTFFIMCLSLTSLDTMADNTKKSSSIRVATFNVSMEALNYIDRSLKPMPNIKGDELINALDSGHQQIKNIAEIIQRINPDIILLNEFDYSKSGKAAQTFINLYLNKSQNKQNKIHFPHFYQASVNTGIKTPFDLNNDNKIQLPADSYGYGHFPGHFGMLLLSKYPIDKESIRTFQKFKWKDMPNALKPIDPETNSSWYSDEAWQGMRLSSKSHWDVPIMVNGRTIHIFASHPTPPVFDGPEDRNGRRNHDEIRFWHDYISDGNNQYIYDDNNQYGGFNKNNAFIILGDLNASATEGDAINSGIKALLTHPKLQDALPQSVGATNHSKDNIHAKYHTAYWRMRADYVVPSKHALKIVDSGVFWPEQDAELYRLIEDRNASSDHRLVWLDIQISQ